MKILVSSACCALFSPVLHGATLISSLNLPNSSFNGLNDTSFRQGSDFLTSESGAIVTSAEISIFNADSAIHTLTVFLYSNGPTDQPGSPVGVFDTLITIPPTGSGPGSAITLSAFDLGIALDASTKYWIVLALNEAPITNTVHWTAHEPPNASFDSTSVFSSIPSTRTKFSGDSGTTWGDTLNGNFRYALNGTLVPEPSSGCLALLMASAYLTMRRKNEICSSSNGSPQSI